MTGYLNPTSQGAYKLLYRRDDIMRAVYDPKGLKVIV